MKLKQILAGILSAAMVVTSVPIQGGVAKAASSDKAIGTPVLKASGSIAEGMSASSDYVYGENLQKHLADVADMPVTVNVKEGTEPSFGEADTDDEGSFSGQFYVSRSDPHFTASLDFTNNPLVVSFEVKRPGTMGEDTEDLFGIFNKQYGVQIEKDGVQIFANPAGGGWPTVKKSVSADDGTFWNQWRKVVVRYDGSKMAVAIDDGTDDSFTDTATQGTNDGITFDNVQQKDFTIGYNPDSSSTSQFPGSMRNFKVYSQSIAGDDSVKTAEDIEGIEAAIEALHGTPELEFKPVEEYTASTTWKLASGAEMSDTHFEDGLTYEMTTVLTAGRGFTFEGTEKPTSIVVGEVDAEDAESPDDLVLGDEDVVISEDGSTMTITKLISIADNVEAANRVLVDISNVPVANSALPTVTTDSDAADTYTVEEVQWTNDSGSEMSENCEANTDATVTVKVKPVEGKTLTVEHMQSARFNVMRANDQGSKYVTPTSISWDGSGNLVMSYTFAIKDRAFTYYAGDVKEDGTVELSDADKVFYNGIYGIRFDATVTYHGELQNKFYAIATLADGNGNFYTFWHNPAIKSFSCCYKTESGTGTVYYWANNGTINDVVADTPYRMMFFVNPRKANSAGDNRMIVGVGAPEGTKPNTGYQSTGVNTAYNFLYTSAGANAERWQVNQVLIGKKAPDAGTVMVGNSQDGAGDAGELVDAVSEEMKIGYVKISNNFLGQSAAMSNEAVAQPTDQKNALQAYVDSLASYNKEDYVADTWTAFERALGDANTVLALPNPTLSQISGAYGALQSAEAGLEKLVKAYLTKKLNSAEVIEGGYADSNEATGEASGTQGQIAKAVDGDLATYWHSTWSDDTKPNISAPDPASRHNNYFIKLKDAQDLKGITYAARVTGYNGGKVRNNGVIKKFNVYTSTEDVATYEQVTDWQVTTSAPYEPYYTYSNRHASDNVGDSANTDNQEKEYVFDQLAEDVRWVKIEMVATEGSNLGDNNAICAREFGLLGAIEISSANAANKEKAELLLQMQETLAEAQQYYYCGNADPEHLDDADSTKYGVMDYEAFEDAFTKLKDYLEDYENTDLSAAEGEGPGTVGEAIKEAVDDLNQKMNFLEPEVSTPEFDVTAPVIEGTPVNAVQTNNFYKYSVESDTWKDSSDAAVTTFEEGQEYKEELILKIKDGTGLKFTEETSAADLEVPYGAISAEGTVSEDGLQMTITYTFTANVIQTPTLTVDQAPMLQAAPNSVQFTVPEDAYYQIDTGSITWSADGLEDAVSKFDYGYTYVAKVPLKMKGDHAAALFGKNDVVAGASSCEIEDAGRTMNVYMSFAMPGLTRWEEVKGEAAIGDSEEKFFRSVLNKDYPDMVTDILFKYDSDDQKGQEGVRYPLLTVTDGAAEDAKYMSFWIQPKATDDAGKGAVGFEGTGVQSANPAQDVEFQIDDTKWHKMTILLKHTEADAYTYVSYVDGTKIVEATVGTTPGATDILNNFFSFSGGNYAISKAFIGTMATGVSYNDEEGGATMTAFPGTVKYVELRTEAAESAAPGHDHSEHHKQAGQTIMDKYDSLKTQCDAIITQGNDADKYYSNESWTAFNTAWTSTLNKDATNEWDVYNAVDEIEAALKELNTGTKCGCTLDIGDVSETINIKLGSLSRKTVDFLDLLKSQITVSHADCSVHTDEEDDYKNLTFEVSRAEGCGSNMAIEAGKLVLTGAGTVKVNVVAKNDHKTAEGKVVTIKVTTDAYEALDQLIQSAETTYPENGPYGRRRMEALKKAIQNAKTLEAQPTITASQIAKASAALTRAIENMELADWCCNIQTDHWDDEVHNEQLGVQDDIDTWLYQIKTDGTWSNLPTEAFKENASTTDGVQNVWMSDGNSTYGQTHYASIRRTQLTPCFQDSDSHNQAIAYTWVKENGDWSGADAPEYAKIYLKSPVSSASAGKADVTLQITQETTGGEETVLAEQTIAKGAQSVDVSGFFGIARMSDLKYLRLAALKNDNDIKNIEVAVVASTKEEYAEFAQKCLDDAKDIDLTGKTKASRDAMNSAIEALDEALKEDPQVEDTICTTLIALKKAEAGLVDCTCSIESVTLTLDAIEISAEELESGKTVTLTPVAALTGDSSDGDDTDAVEYTFEASGAGASIEADGKTLKVTKAGKVEVKVTASINGHVYGETVTATAEVTTPALKALKDYIQSVESKYPNNDGGTYEADKWTAMQGALADSKGLAESAKADKAELDESDFTDSLNALKNAVMDLICKCTLEITSFEVADIDMAEADMAAGKTVDLTNSVQATASKNDCAVPEHTDTNVTYTFAIARNGAGAGATVQGTSLKVTKAGKVTLQVTAAYHDRTATKTVTVNVTTPNSKALSEYVAGLKTTYPNTEDDKVGYPEAEWNALQSAITEAETLLAGATVDKTEEELAAQKTSLESKVSNLKNKTTCNCTLEITAFNLGDLAAIDLTAEELQAGGKTVDLTDKVTVKADDTHCRVGERAGHNSKTATLSFSVVPSDSTVAEVSGKTVKVKKAGKVTIRVRATFNGKTAQKTADMTVTTPALKELNTYLEQVKEQYSESDYTADSWAVLDAAITAAEALKDAATVEESDIAAKKKAVEDAVAALVENTPEDQEKEELVDSLQSLVSGLADKAAGSGEDYEEEGWNDFVRAYEAAQAALSQSDDLDKAALQEAYDNLDRADKALKKRDDQEKEDQEKEELVDSLQSLVGDVTDKAAGSSEDYDEESWNAFVKAYEAAQTALSQSDDLDKDALQEAYDNLDRAYRALKTKEEQAKEKAEQDLQKALDEMQRVLGAGQGDYSDETWEAFRQAYIKAKNHASGMTAEELQNLLRDLNAAKNALAENKQPTDEKKPQPEQGGQKQPAVDNLPKAGSQYTVGKLVYQVKTSTAADKTVMVVKPVKKTDKKLTIPATVKISGYDYKVVEIKASAFAKNKKLTTVKIGKNVTNIGRRAFFGCAKLKKVSIKAAGLKTIGKQAFAKINKKARIRVPKKQLKTLKKKLKKAKTIKSAKITK